MKRDAAALPAPGSTAVWLLAVLRLGAVGCPMNTRLPNRTVAELLRRIDCRTLVVDAADTEGLGDVTTLRGRGLSRARTSTDDSARIRTIPLQRPMTIVHTSGSAGVPKAVLHTCGNHYYNALGSNVNLPLTAEDRWLLDLPLHHVAGLGIVFRCLLAGGDAGPGRESRRRPGSVWSHASVGGRDATAPPAGAARPGAPRLVAPRPGGRERGSAGAPGPGAGTGLAGVHELWMHGDGDPGSVACTAISPCGGSIHGCPCTCRA